MSEDTIFALASAAGRAGVAVIRLSGPAAAAAIGQLGCKTPPPRKAVRAKFIHPATAEVVDDGLLLWFPAPHSFTGEDVAELHIHSGRATIDEILSLLATAPGCRMAEPGEFTRRAFAHGKMDLTQAEALADLVDAETTAQARQALRQMSGALKDRYESWRRQLIDALAHLEAVIDFPDEDLPPDVAAKVWDRVAVLDEDIRSHLDDGGRGERIREGLAIAIVGAPNAGKSTLLNALAERDAAIVAATPGTTRDVIDVHLDLGGYAVTIADTAGLREAGDDIENEGIRRARVRAETADIKIALFDGAQYPLRDAATSALIDGNTVVVVTKADVIPAARMNSVTDVHFISVHSGAGMTAFRETLTAAVKARIGDQAAAPLTRQRHRKALEDCRSAFSRARATVLPELAAEDLRLAARALGRLTGRVEVDEILDAVFRDFCIGK